MAKRPVRPIKPAPGGGRAAAAAREQATQRREAGRAAAPPAKPAVPKLPSYVARRQGQPGAFAAPLPAYPAPLPSGRPVATQFASTYPGNLPLYVAMRQNAPGAFGMATQPLQFGGLPIYPAMRQGLPGAYAQAGAGQATYNPRGRGALPVFGAQPRPPVRQGTMTKARAPVTARPYVQLEPPEAEAAYTAPEQAPYYPTGYDAGGYDTGGGYGGYGGGGGGGEYPPREVPPWYYGLVSWRF